MSASTADLTNVIIPTFFPTMPLTIGSTTVINRGTLVGRLTSTGLGAPLADTANMVFMGLAARGVNQGGVTGATTVDIENSTNNRFLSIPATSPLTAWIGLPAYALDDQTVGITSTNSVKVGLIVLVQVTGTSGRVVVDTLR